MEGASPAPDKPRSALLSWLKWAFIAVLIVTCLGLFVVLGPLFVIILPLIIWRGWFRLRGWLVGKVTPLASVRPGILAIGLAVLLLFAWVPLYNGLNGGSKATPSPTVTARATPEPTIMAQALAVSPAPAAATAVRPSPTSQPATPILPLPTATPTPTATLSPEAALARVGQDHFKAKLKAAKLSPINVSDLERALSGTPMSKEQAAPKPGDRVTTYATVDYDLGAQWDEAMAVRSATLDLAQFVPKLFALNGIDALELRAYASFKDVYGNSKDEVAFKFTITRETAGKVNWAQVDRRNLGIILSGGLNGVYVHPALRSAWNDYTAR